MDSKTCKDCSETKEVSEFTKAGTRNGKQRYKARCKDCYNKQSRQKYADNPEISSAEYKKWYAKNRDHVSEYGKQYRASNREKVAAKDRAYREKNPDYQREKNANYRARRRNATLEPMPIGWLRMLLDFYGKCLNPDCESVENLTHDHIVALKNKGLHELKNLQVLCKSCNSSKKDLHASDYRDIRTGLLVGCLYGNRMVMSRPRVIRMEPHEVLAA